MRNFKLMEGAELKRLAPLSGPSGRHARAELERRHLLGVFLAESPEVAERKTAEVQRFQERVNALTADAEPVKAEVPSEPARKPKRKR